MAGFFILPVLLPSGLYKQLAVLTSAAVVFLLFAMSLSPGKPAAGNFQTT